LDVDRPVWTPPEEPNVLESRLRQVFRNQWPVMLSAAESAPATGLEAQIFDVPGAPPMRMKIALLATQITNYRNQRSAVRADLIGIAAQDQQLWDVQAVAFIDRDTKAILDLSLRASVNLSRV
jgi:hypothetical protein